VGEFLEARAGLFLGRWCMMTRKS